MTERALISHIQRYSLHDGPGIRTVVFFKGCPLRCRWCCNPETQRAQRELFFRVNRCIGQEACGFCAAVCPAGAIAFLPGGASRVNRTQCTACFRCVSCCPSGARETSGEWKTADEILDLVERDAAFYHHGNGGLTLSGGEPLMQGAFLVHLLKKARERRLHTVMETCGYGEYDLLATAAAGLDTLFFDLKSLDRERHIAATGHSNDRILKNFERLCADFPALDKRVRTPLIPGFNDAPEELRNIRAYLRCRPNVRFETLPYHRLGEEKYKSLGRTGDMRMEN
jgi:pyruvate formate lyase activating enzyme